MAEVVSMNERQSNSRESLLGRRTDTRLLDEPYAIQCDAQRHSKSCLREADAILTLLDRRGRQIATSSRTRFTLEERRSDEGARIDRIW